MTTGNTQITSVSLSNRNNYWTEEVNNAIEEYLEINKQLLAAESRMEHLVAKEFQSEKDLLFSKSILKPLSQMIEKIIFRYKISEHGLDAKTVHDECLGFVYEKFTNFNPHTKTKAFSYYSTIAKSYCINEIWKKKKLTK